jgi:hypothetical protein
MWAGLQALAIDRYEEFSYKYRLLANEYVRKKLLKI